MAVVKSERASFEDLAARTAPFIALVGCPDVHGPIASKIGRQSGQSNPANLRFKSLSFPQLTDTLREKKVKVSELHAPAKNLLNLGALRDYVTLPAVIGILVEWNRQNVRQAEGELFELETAVSKQLDDIKVLNAHKNLKLVVIMVERYTQPSPSPAPLPTANSSTSLSLRDPEERFNSVRRMMHTTEIKQSFWSEQDPDGSAKKLERVLLESAKSYIEEKIERAKKARKKQDAFTPQQGILNELKIALLAESLQDQKQCQKYFVAGYQALCTLSALEQPDELDQVAEFLNLKLCQLLLDDQAALLASITDDSLSPEDALKPVLQQLNFHISKFRPLLEALREEADGWHFAWSSRQYELFAELLTQYPSLVTQSSNPGYYYQTAASLILQRRKFIRMQKANQSNSENKNPDSSMSEGSGKYRVPAEKAADLLTNAYNQLKSLPSASRSLFHVVAQLGDEYVRMRQYQKGLKTYERIIKQFQQSHWTWWPLLVPIVRGAMLCALKLQLLPEYVHYGLALLSEQMELPIAERKKVQEVLQNVLKDAKMMGFNGALEAPIDVALEPDDGLISARVLLVTSSDTVSAVLCLRSKLPLPVRFANVVLCVRESVAAPLQQITFTRSKHEPGVILHPHKPQQFAYEFTGLREPSGFKCTRIVLQLGENELCSSPRKSAKEVAPANPSTTSIVRFVWEVHTWESAHAGLETFEEPAPLLLAEADVGITDESGQVLSKPKRAHAPTLRLKKNHLLLRSLRLAAAQYNELKERLVPMEIAEKKVVSLAVTPSLPDGAVEAINQYKSVRSNVVFSTADVPREALRLLSNDSGLTSLILSNNFISDAAITLLVSGLARHPTVTLLDLADSHLPPRLIAAVSKIIETNTVLQHFSLFNNLARNEGAAAIASSLAHNKALLSLNVGHNFIDAEGIQSLCAAAQNHPTLTALKLWYNRTGDDGARAVVELLKVNTRITTMDLRSNDIKAVGGARLAAALPKFVQLKELCLQDNDLGKSWKDIAEALKHHYGLLNVADGVSGITELTKRNFDLLKEQKRRSTEFRFNGSHLYELPVSVLLPHITYMDISDNSIASLPPEMAALTALTSLNVAKNSLNAVPRFLGTFQLLTLLDLSANRIEVLRPEIGELTALSTLNIRGNLLKELPPQIGKLARLTTMDISQNWISVLPPEISRLSALSSLIATECGLEALMIDLRAMPAMRLLDLSRNKLSSLPSSIGKLHASGGVVKYEGNPLDYIPPEVVAKGAKALYSYLDDLDQGYETCRKVKLMFVGQENVGKTTLLKVLREGTNLRNKVMSAFTGKGYRLSTEGIDIEEWSPVPDLTLAAWDFGGQEVYHNTHQLFLSHRSVFLLVFNMAVALESNRIIGWLNAIQSRASSAPVVLVGTNADNKVCTKQHIAQVNEKLTQAVKRWIASVPQKERLVIEAGPDTLFHQVSCVKGSGLEALEKRIVEIAARQPYLQEKIPKVYLKLLEVLKQRRKRVKQPFISWKHFREWGVIADEAQLRRATELLHDWGELLCFSKPKQLQDLVVINPQWLTKFLATVVRPVKDHHTMSHIVRRETLASLWKEFPADLHPMLESLLQKFEIWAAIQVGGSPAYLVTSLLPRDRPSDAWIADKDPIGRLYSLPFAPHGFFSRFLVRTLRFCVPAKYWSCGAVLTADGCEALVELKEGTADYEALFSIMVKGVRAARLLRQIVFLVHGFLQDWYGNLRSKVAPSVPCPACITAFYGRSHSKRPPSVGAFPLQTVLQTYFERSDSTLPCPQCKLQLPSKSLLPEIVECVDQNYETEIQEIRELGTGGFATVYLAKWRGKDVAVKKMKGSNVDLDQFEEFCQEMTLMTRLNHPHVVKYLASYAQPLAIVLEFVPFGGLDGLIRQWQGAHNWRIIKQVALDMAQAMLYLHSQQPAILHRDFKSANVLVSEWAPEQSICRVKVADLGLSCMHFGEAGRVVDNPRWLAPEVLRGENYTPKSDVFSYGMVMYELVARQIPFYENHWDSQVEDAIMKGSRPTVPEGVLPAYSSVMIACWAEDAMSRPTFTEIEFKLRKLES